MHRRRPEVNARVASLVAALVCASASPAGAQAAAGQPDHRVSFTWSVAAGAQPCASQLELEQRVTAG
ncbi:MAG: hypothetical protein WKG00_37175 [Polyangiaceae bacterium]